MNLREICLAFLDQDDDAKAWGSDDREVFSDAPDCDVMATRFARFAQARGRAADVVRVELDAAQDSLGGGAHWFTVIDGVAVDWTARQFHDVHGVQLDPSEIPSPMLFIWPGPFPIPTVTVQEVVAP